MTTELDPIRWTASIDEAPEILRAPLVAAAKEGPSSAQMRMLALKLAAVSAGAATAAAASTAHASASASTAGGVAAAPVAALPLAKIVAAVAVVGVAAWGGVSMLARPVTPQLQRNRATIDAPASDAVGAQKHAPASTGLQAPVPVPMADEPNVEDVPAAAEIQGQASTARQTKAAGSGSAGTARDAQIKAAKATVAGKGVTIPAAGEAHENVGKTDVPSEVELLRKARASLAGRPREAYALTEQHREHYPRGVFAQERDALAIEALLRAGDTDAARGLARSFVSAHPNSPHAHRFRETLGLR